MLKVGDKAPAFKLPADDGSVISLANLKGKRVILYFYPKDHTPGCTLQACHFRDTYEQFDKKNTVILGVSRDSVKRHQSFKKAHHLPFLLLADEEGTVCQAYDVMQEKSMFGKKYFGIERSTFLIDEKGILQGIWRKVKVPNHVKNLLKEI